MDKQTHDDFTLLAQLVDGRMTVEELRQVEERLMTDAEFRRRYIRFVDMDFELSQRLDKVSSNAPSSLSYPDLISSPATTSKPVPLRGPSHMESASPRFGRVFLSIAVALAIGLGSLWFAASYMLSPTPSDVAEQPSRSFKALVWSVDDESGDWKQGAVLTAGEHSLPSGSAEIRLVYEYESPINSESQFKEQFSAGVRLMLEGPSQFTLLPSGHVELQTGKLSADVAPIAKGFTVTANGVEVVDLGTRFAVTANLLGDASVHVYEGLVKASLMNSGINPTKLITGETMRLNLEARRLEEIEFQSDSFAPQPSWNGSLEEVSPTVHILNRPPKDAKRDKQASSEKSFVFKERDGLILSHEITVNLAEPRNVVAKRESWGDYVTTIPPGTQVTSYLANFAKEGDALTGKATLKFDSPILGVIYSADLMMKTDRMLGSPDTNYKLHGKHASDILTGLEGGAQVEIHEDRRTVTCTYARPVGNQVRIIVAKDPR